MATFPNFGDEYDGEKMRELIAALERLFARRGQQQAKLSIVNTATYDVVDDDEKLLVDRSSTGVCTINLPSAGRWQGRSLVVYDRGSNASVNNITIGSVYVINVDERCVTITSDGTNWFVERIV